MFSGATLVPNVLILISGVAVLLLITFLVALIIDRNPLPFPDRDYHVFSASSLPALAALEQLMQKFGHHPRFRIDSDHVDRTVFSNGTIINHPHPQISAILGNPAVLWASWSAIRIALRASPRNTFKRPGFRPKSFLT